MNESRFKLNSDGTVTDISTGLMWQQKITAKKMTWEKARRYCKRLSLNGHDDWRLPTIEELYSLINHTRYNPAIDITVFPDIITSHYWSSTIYVNNTVYAWCVNFYNGNVFYDLKSHIYYVRAVRDNEEVR